MAKKSITTLTPDMVGAFVKNAEYRKELACDRITGFHLQKLVTGASWRFRYRGADNKWKIINLGKLSAVDRIEAASEAKALAATVDKGGDPVLQREKQREQQRIDRQKALKSTLRAFFESYYKEHYQQKRDGQGAIRRIQYHFNEVHDLFDRQLASLNKNDIHAWQRKCWNFVCPVRPTKTDKQNPSRKVPNVKTLEHATIQRAFNALKTLLNLAVQHEIIEFNPLTYPNRVKLLNPPSNREAAAAHIDEKKHRRYLADDELQAIRRGVNEYREVRRGQRIRSAQKGNKLSGDYCATEDTHPDWFFPFFELAAYTGCASGDLYTLTWGELSLDKRQLTFTRNKTIDKAKNAGKDPLVINMPLNERIVQVMTIWHRQTGSPETGLVFPSERKLNKGIPPEKCYRDKNNHDEHWRKVKELGGVDAGLHFYSLRHHFISIRVADGRPMLEVARMVGHRSAKMIEEHYGHLAPNAEKEAMSDRFDNFG